MRQPRAREKVIELLKTLDDALTDGSLVQGDGGGIIQMPVLYHHGSYQELERCLSEMRDTHRMLRWHLMHRYVWGDPDKWLRVPSRKTRQGRIPILPERAELRIQGETLAHGVVVVKCYTWSERVEPRYVERGIDLLTAMMYDGDTSRIHLPKPFLERLTEGGSSAVSPRQGHLPSHPLPAT